MYIARQFVRPNWPEPTHWIHGLQHRVTLRCGFATYQPAQYSDQTNKDHVKKHLASSGSSTVSVSSSPSVFSEATTTTSPSWTSQSLPEWDENPDLSISTFSQLPHSNFGVNQHMVINQEFKEALRQILWQFKAPIRYAFAYGSAVFPQKSGSSTGNATAHLSAGPATSTAQQGTGKMVDLIFGVSYTQHWHSLNLSQHRDHYSALGSLGSGLVTRVQEKWGAGVYFNPYVMVNGTLIKYGVVNLDTLCQDLSEWRTLYLAGRLQKPVKILRDDPRVRLANQINLISALRTALLLLPASFTERQLYSALAGISYQGDLRMSLRTENPQKVDNIVSNQMTNFRRLYSPLVADLPNLRFADPRCDKPGWHNNDSTGEARLEQDMDLVKRGNMVRRLPRAFREKVYFEFQRRYRIPRVDFDRMMEASSARDAEEDASHIKRRQGGPFEQRIAADEEGLALLIPQVIKRTIAWPSTSQSIKGLVTAGTSKTVRYLTEKASKWREGRHQQRDDAENKKKGQSS